MTGMAKFALAYVLRRAGVFERFPQLQLRGRFRAVKFGGRSGIYINHSQGRITSQTTKTGPRSQNSRTGKTTYDLPGPLKWVGKGRNHR